MADTPDVVTQIPAADLTIDSKNPVLLGNLAMLAKMGAPALPDGITFQDYLAVSPGGVLPVHNTIFHAKVNGVWVDETMSDYLLVQFPIVAYDLLLGKGMITPGPGTPNMPVFQAAPSADQPMVYDATKVINGVGANPGNFGFPVKTSVPGGVLATDGSAVGSQGIFGKQ
jgi:hypothetical protein